MNVPNTRPTPPQPVRCRTLIAVGSAIIAAFLVIVVCGGTREASATPRTVWYVDVLRCGQQSVQSHRYDTLKPAVHRYGVAIAYQASHHDVTYLVRMRTGADGSYMSRLVAKRYQSCGAR
jgi:hypothetical protein